MEFLVKKLILAINLLLLTVQVAASDSSVQQSRPVGFGSLAKSIGKVACSMATAPATVYGAELARNAIMNRGDSSFMPPKSILENSYILPSAAVLGGCAGLYFARKDIKNVGNSLKSTLFPDLTAKNDQGRTRIEACIDSITQSRLASYVAARQLKNNKANDEYFKKSSSELNSEIQDRVKKIAAEMSVDISNIKMREINNSENHVGAFTTTGYLVFNTAYCFKSSRPKLDYLEHLIRHELTHIKNNDAYASDLCAWLGGISAGRLGSLLVGSLMPSDYLDSKVQYCVSNVLTPAFLFLATNIYLEKKFQDEKGFFKYFKEKRADENALYSLGSAKKVLDLPDALATDFEGDDYSLKGYRIGKHYLDIAEHLVEQGKGDGVTKEMIQERRTQLAQLQKHQESYTSLEKQLSAIDKNTDTAHYQEVNKRYQTALAEYDAFRLKILDARNGETVHNAP